MKDGDQLGSIAVILVFVLTAVVAGATALSGIAAAHSGNVNQLDAISEDGSELEVEIESTTSPVTEGDPLEVTATVTNTGDASDTQEIALAVDGGEENSTTVTLDGGDSQTVTLTWQTEAGDAGDHEATVASEDDSETTEITVN